MPLQSQRLIRSRPSLTHLAGQVFDSPLMIIPEKLETILRAVGPRLTVDQSALDEIYSSGVLRPRRAQEVVAYDYDDDEDDNYSSNSRRDNRPYKVLSGGIAVIPVSGVLLKNGSWMSALSGCSSYAQIKSAVSCAMDDGDVRGLLFDINSPGGTTHGCFELSDYIYSCRGNKPMYAIANDLAASTAYAIASACDKVYVTITGAVGSVGVFAMHYEQSGLDEKEGMSFTYLFAGARKVDGNPHEPLSKSARASIQKEVEREYDLFTACVARNRGVKESSVVATEAECLFASEAIPLLADKLATKDDVIAELTAKLEGDSVTLSTKRSAGLVDPTKMLMLDKAADKEADMETRAEVEVQLKKLQAKLATIDFAATATSATAATSAIADTAPVAKSTPTPADSPDDSDKDDEEDCDPNMSDTGDKGQDKSADKPADKKSDNEMKGNTNMPPIESTTSNAEAIAAAVLAAQERTEAIMETCEIAGLSLTEANTFVKSTMTMKEIRAKINETRVAEGDKTKVNSQFGSANVDGLDTLTKQAQTIAANSHGAVKPSKALEMAMLANPAAYEAYEDQRKAVYLTPTRQAIGAYVTKIQGRAAALGLHSQLG